MRLWSVQKEAVREYEARGREGYRRLLVVLPTGGGKTVFAAEVVRRNPELRVLFVAHTREIIEQAFDKFIRAGIPRTQIGFILSKDKRVNAEARVQVATIQTLSRRDHPAADLVIVDEAHHAVAKTYAALLALYPEANVLGLTATPVRGDGRGLGEVGFEGIIVAATPLDLIAQKHLVTPHVRSVSDEDLPDVKGVRLKHGDYDIPQLERRVNRRKLIGSIVAHYEQHAGKRSAVVYAVTKKQARNLARAFRRRDHDVELLYGIGDTTLPERQRILGRLDRGERVIVINVGVLLEGWDCPPAKCCIIARPTRSWTLHMQMVGRFLRPWKGVQPIVLDHAGNCVMHGLPQQTRDFALAMPRHSPSTSLPPAKKCPECFAIVATGTKTCPDCGYEFGIEREPKHKRGELVEMKYVPSEEEKAAALERIKRVAQEKGADDAWVQSVFNAMFAA